MIYDAIVVGAGPAGVTAARDLCDAEKSTLLLEARDRLGGRTWSRPLSGYESVIIEAGGMYIHTAVQHNLRREIARYGAAISEGQGALSVLRFNIRGVLQDGGSPVPLDDLAACERLLVSITNAARRIDTNAAVTGQHVADLDVSIDSFVDPTGLSPQGKEVVYGIIANVMQADVAEVSMLQWLRWIAGSDSSSVNTFFGVGEEKLADGTMSLWRAMVDDSEVDLEFSCDVVAIEQTSDGVTVHSAAGAEYSARTCVLAVPTQVLHRIEIRPALSEAKLAHLEKPYVQHGFKNYLVVEDAPKGFLGYGSHGNENDPSIGWLHEDQSLPDGRTLMIAWGYQDHFHSTAAEAQDSLEQYIPGAKVVGVDGHNWSDDPYSDGMVRLHRPGEAQTLARDMSGRDGRITLAGTDVTRTIWNAWIEGAVDSGRVAAESTISFLRSEA